jgi:hypothetical protein
VSEPLLAQWQGQAGERLVKQPNAAHALADADDIRNRFVCFALTRPQCGFRVESWPRFGAAFSTQRGSTMRHGFLVFLCALASCATGVSDAQEGSPEVGVSAQALLPSAGDTWEFHAGSGDAHFEVRGDVLIHVFCLPLEEGQHGTFGGISLQYNGSGAFQYNAEVHVTSHNLFNQRTDGLFWEGQWISAFDGTDTSQRFHHVAAPAGFDTCDNMDATVTVTLAQPEPS